MTDFHAEHADGSPALHWDGEVRVYEAARRRLTPLCLDCGVEPRVYGYGGRCGACYAADQDPNPPEPFRWADALWGRRR